MDCIVRRFTAMTSAILLTVTMLACGQTTGPEDVSAARTMYISPSEVDLLPSEGVQFESSIQNKKGNNVGASVVWEATGGTISTTGYYVAGNKPGTYWAMVESGRDQARAKIRILEPTQTSSDPSPGPSSKPSPEPNPDPSPEPSPEPSPTGAVEISPGASIQSAVESHPAGTTFLIKTGVHRSQSIRPKDGMTFVGETGAVLDGENAVTYAFVGGSSSASVTIRNLEIRNYVPPLQYGAIRAGGAAASDGSTGWVVENCNIHHNAAGAIRLGHRMVVRGNKILYNGQIGIVGIGDNVLVEDNEIAYNNTRGIDPGWEAGGSKFVRTRDLVLRGNYVHDNKGPGLWMDGNNINSLVENNRVINNRSAAGIFFEISYGAVIRNNRLEGNGNPGGWLYGSEILVSASSDVEVYGNTVVAGFDGITAVMQNRGSGVLGRFEVKNLYVHDNKITMKDGFTGLGQDIGDASYFSSKNNRFQRNTYYLGANSRYFEWMDGQRTETQWQGYGQDVNGTFNR